MATLKELKDALKGRKLFVWVNVFGEDGGYIPAPKEKFLNAIGADVAHYRGGLHNDTAVDMRIDGDSVYVG